MATNEDETSGADRMDAVLRVRIPAERVDLVRLIADSETDGNVSGLIRSLIDQKISERLSRSRR